MKKQVKEETIKAHELWEKILESQIETELLICYIKMQLTESNQKNLGTIRSSNLCTEIMGILLLMSGCL
jgi:ribonucleoside-diphosphate reductase alpha chain